VVDHQGVNVVLFVLVFSAAMTLPVRALTDLRSRAVRLGAVEVLAIVGVPLITWSAAHLVPAGPIRMGITSIGVAPAEVATVALTAAALGRTATAAALLVASTVVSVLFAAPILELIAGGTGVHSRDLLVTLLAVVVAPFVLGVGIHVGFRLQSKVGRRGWPAAP
jgi:predicted Na+-dependent transporter